jgi:hypothetical protein
MMHSADPGGQASPPMMREAVRPVHAARTLIQPDLPPDLLLTKQMPLPQVLIWTAGQTQVVKITPPRPQIANTPISHVSLEAPNEQVRIAELKISASAFDSSKLTLLPSTTAPVVVHRPNLPAQMPVAASSSVGLASPARVISLSDVQLERGTIVLPALNDVGAADGDHDSAPKTTLAGGGGNGAEKHGGSGTGTEGDRGNGRSSAGGDNQLAQIGTRGQGGTADGSGRNVQGNGGGDGSGPDSAPGDGTSITEIRQPMDGQFSAVVVGSSIAERYPETMELWAGRLAYTVYLHVGLTKNWILQYAVTRDAASVGGNAAQPNAPWPYFMERPRLIPGDLNADALMIHGRLNVEGRFEALNIVFPSDFSQAQFVLSALRQWRFRPARQDGRLIAVEILLIIPEED